MITLRWEQMERAQEVDLLVVAVLCSLDQLSVAPISSCMALMPLSFMISYSRSDPFARQLKFRICSFLAWLYAYVSF